MDLNLLGTIIVAFTREWIKKCLRLNGNGCRSQPSSGACAQVITTGTCVQSAGQGAPGAPGVGVSKGFLLLHPLA